MSTFPHFQHLRSDKPAVSPAIASIHGPSANSRMHIIYDLRSCSALHGVCRMPHVVSCRVVLPFLLLPSSPPFSLSLPLSPSLSVSLHRSLAPSHPRVPSPSLPRSLSRFFCRRAPCAHPSRPPAGILWSSRQPAQV